MLSNAYFLAKFRFDTAENEPAKNLQKFRKMHFRKMHFRKMRGRVALGAEARGLDARVAVRAREVRDARLELVRALRRFPLHLPGFEY